MVLPPATRIDPVPAPSPAGYGCCCRLVKVVKCSLLSGQCGVNIYPTFYTADAARSLAGRIVRGEVFAGAQQKLSAQKREPKSERAGSQDDGENIVKVSSMRRYNNSKVNNNNNATIATTSAPQWAWYNGKSFSYDSSTSHLRPPSPLDFLWHFVTEFLERLMRHTHSPTHTQA